MLEIATIVAAIGALVFLAHFFAWLFSFTSIPDGLLLLLVGLLVGPVAGLIEPSFFGQFGQVILTITLVIMLFESGTRLQLIAIKKSLSGTFLLTVTSFTLSALSAGVLVWFLTDLSPLVSAMAGAIVGGTTSAVVIPLIDSLKFISSNSRALLIVESALSDVLSIVITIALLQAYDTGSLEFGSLSLWLLASFAYSALFGIIAGLIWSLLLTHVRHMRNSIFVTVAFLFLLFGFVETIGMSGPIMALLFGLTLGNAGALNQYLANRHRLLQWLFQPTTLSRRERAFFAEIVFLLQTFFFIFVGLAISFADQSALLVGASITTALLLVRMVSVRLTVGRFVTKKESAIMSVLIPKGLAAAVLASLLVQEGVVGGEFVQHLVYAIVLSSIVLTSLLAFTVSRTVSSYAGATRGGDNQARLEQGAQGQENIAS